MGKRSYPAPASAPSALYDDYTVSGINGSYWQESYNIVATAARTFAAPIGGPEDGNRIRILITNSGGAWVHTFTGGAGGFAFANSSTTAGVTLAQHDTLAALVTDGKVYEVGFEYHSGVDRYLCNALAGFWL